QEVIEFIKMLRRCVDLKIGFAPLASRRSPDALRTCGWVPLKELLESISESIREQVCELVSTGISADTYTLKALTGEAELIDGFRLRYAVYETMNYAREKNRLEIDIDEFDRFSVPLGIIENRTGSLVGYLRIVTTEEQPFYVDKIGRIIEKSRE